MTIVRVIEGSGVTLKKETDDRYRGHCPFHHDSKPSFVVTPSLHLFHCFGCGASGNTIQYVQKLKSLSFVAALKELHHSH